MGIFNKKDIVKIAQEDLNDAKLSSVVFTEENRRRKSFIDVLGARLAMKLLFSKKIEANNLYSLYTIHNVLGQLDISDIYYNGIKIDVRVVFDQNEIFIPKSHFQHGILPDLYLILTLNQDLSSAELLGCFEPKNLDQSLQNDDCYFFEQENLTKPEQLKTYLDNFKTENTFQSSPEALQKAETLFLTAIDGEISRDDKTFLFQQLANSFELREKFVELENFELISQMAANDETLSRDDVLEIVASQKVFNEAEAAEAAGLELETETIIFEPLEQQVDEGQAAETKSISWADIEELPEDFDEEILEKSQGEETPSQNNFAATLAEGAIIVGSAAVAGGILAAGAASLAQGSAAATVTATASAVEGLANIGSSAVSSIIDNITDTKSSADTSSFDDILKDENLIASTDEEIDSFSSSEESDDEIDFLEGLSEIGEVEEVKQELAEESDDEIDFLEELSEIGEVEEVKQELTEESDDEIDFLEELSEIGAVEEVKQELTEESDDEIDFLEGLSEIGAVEEVKQELAEESDDEIDFLEELSEIGAVEEVNEIAEVEESDEQIELMEENSEFELFENEVQLFAPLEELSDEELFSPQDDLKEPTTLGELPVIEELNELADASFAQDDEKDDTVELDNFDFGLFDDEIQAEAKPEPAKVETTNEGTLSFEALSENISKETNSDYGTELDDTELEELDDDDIVAKGELGDLSDISSQVDDLLKDMELSEDKKNLLQNEITLEQENLDKEEEILPIAFSTIAEAETVQSKTSQEFNMDIDLLTATGPLEDDKDLLNALFQKEKFNTDTNQSEPLELGDREKSPADEAQKKKKIIIAASVAGVMLVSIIAGGLVLNNKNKAVTFPASTQNSSISPDMQNQAPPAPNTPEMAGAGDLAVGQNADFMDQGPSLAPPQAEQMQQSRDMGKAVSDAFMSEPVTASISKIAWEVPEDVAYNDGFRKYLQIAGKNLKLTLSNDLLLTTEMAYSNKMVVDLKISKTGVVQGSNVTVSSGSKQIDGIVLQSVKETLKYLKMPQGEISGPSVNATLIINF